MPRELGLVRRGNVWTYRRRIPTDLVPAYGGRTERKKSLQTQDYRAAKRFRNHIAAEWDAEFEQKRFALSQPRSDRVKRAAMLNVREVETIIRRYVATKSAEFVSELQSPAIAGCDEVLWEMECECNDNVLSLRDPADAFVGRCIHDLSHEAFSEYSDFEHTLSTTERVHVRELLRRAALELERRKLAALQRKPLDQSFDTAFGLMHDRVVTLKQMADEYLTEHDKTRSVGSKRKHMLRAAAQIVLDFFGPETEVAKLDKNQCRQFRDTLNAIPSNLRKHFPDRDVSFAEMAATAHTRGLPMMAQITQEKYMRLLREILD